MFTGLVQGVGTLHSVDATSDGVRLAIRSAVARELRAGDSVAVNGVCLTATTVNGETFTADVMQETLRRSSLGDAGVGASVNLELPLRASDRLGGHMVQGHVDGLGTVAAVADEGFARRVTISAEPDLLRYVVAKGSIAVDGVSLTVADVGERDFAVSLIPETMERTNLGEARQGAAVNLEVDVLAKYVEKLVGAR